MKKNSVYWAIRNRIDAYFPKVAIKRYYQALDIVVKKLPEEVKEEDLPGIFKMVGEVQRELEERE